MKILNHLYLFVPGPVEILLLLPGLFAIVSFLYIIFNKRNVHNQAVPIAAQVSIYLFALIPLGIIVGGYLAFRKINVNDLTDYKYSKKARLNAKIILIVSIVATIFSLSTF